MATEQTTDPGAGLDTGTEETSLRDDLDAAFEEHATDEGAAAAPAAQGRSRDPAGRFAANQTATTTTEGVAAAASGAAQGQQVATTGYLQQVQPNAGTPPAQPELKAPQSWTPQAREKWASVDPELKAEIHRRESEAGRVIQSAAAQRQFVEQFERLMQPYEMFIRAENSNPLAAVDNMMRTAAQLRVGTPAAKVEIVAGIIKNFGIDLPALDAMLAGQAMPPGTAQQQQPMRDPRVDQLMAMQHQQAQQAAAFEDQSIRQGLQGFAQGHEFYGDVAATMADIVEIKSRQGQAVDLEQVYQQACQMTPNVSTILQQRAQSQTNGTARAAVLRAKRAAVSVKGDSTPTGATIPKNDSVRAAIEAAWDTTND